MSTLGKRVDAVMCLSGSNPDLSVFSSFYAENFLPEREKVFGFPEKKKWTLKRILFRVILLEKKQGL